MKSLLTDTVPWPSPVWPVKCHPFSNYSRTFGLANITMAKSDGVTITSSSVLACAFKMKTGVRRGTGYLSPCARLGYGIDITPLARPPELDIPQL